MLYIFVVSGNQENFNGKLLKCQWKKVVEGSKVDMILHKFGEIAERMVAIFSIYLVVMDTNME